MSVMVVGIGVSLLFVDLGHPLAVDLQHLMGLLAILSGVAVTIRPRVDSTLLPGPSTALQGI